MLQIPAKIEYALTLLIILAQDHKKTKPKSLQGIADLSGMPYRFLTQIVKPLIKAGIIKSKEGKGGGYVLVKHPKNITIKHVLEVLGESFNFAKCFDSTHSCPAGKGCKMKIIWSRIKTSIGQELGKLTLSDLI